MTRAIFRMESLGKMEFGNKCREFIVNKQIILNKKIIKINYEL